MTTQTCPGVRAGSDEAAYELVRQHNRHHRDSADPTCPYCAFERHKKRRTTWHWYGESRDRRGGGFAV